MTAASPAADATQRRWRRCGPALSWSGEPGEGAVFDPASGETHFLSELPALLLSAIDADWCAFDVLVERIAGPLELDPQDQAKIVSSLGYLEGAELVESQHAAGTQGQRA